MRATVISRTRFATRPSSAECDGGP